MRVIMMEVLKPAEVKEIDGSLEGMQSIVGGSIELYCPFEEEVGIIVNEEGKLFGLPENRIVSINDKIVDVLCGPAFIVNLDSEDGNFADLTDEQIERLTIKIGDSVIDINEVKK